MCVVYFSTIAIYPNLRSDKQWKHGYFYKFNNLPPGNYFGSKNRTYSGRKGRIVVLECGSRRGQVFQNNPAILLVFAAPFILMQISVEFKRISLGSGNNFLYFVGNGFVFWPRLSPEPFISLRHVPRTRLNLAVILQTCFHGYFHSGIQGTIIGNVSSF